MAPDDPGANQGVAFGPFRLFAAERLLEKEGVAVPLNSHALDLLIILVGRPGEVVSKRDLIARAWPNQTITESSLRVYVSELRKALGDGRAGARYVTNVSGRGYCFVAPITQVTAPEAAVFTEPIAPDYTQTLPPRLARMVGRDETVRTLSDRLAKQRFVTVRGPGGIGKTTVAIAVGHAWLATFGGAVHFVDLGSISSPRVVPSALASTLGLTVQSSDSTPSLISFLRERRMLLILDSCEHVIEAAASMAERIFKEALQIHILTTSREPLRVEGEHVYQLPALDSPPEGADLSAAQILDFPAAHLFAERVTASGHPFELTDTDAPIVAEICRKLDGMALAIELAASRVSTHGLRETAVLLDDRLKLLWHGRRTALPRHQTLSATLDWSYNLLTDVERVVLQRLSIFVGPFTLEAAEAIASDDELDAAQVVDAVGALVSKSLVSVGSDRTAWYRLLDATRAYANAKLTSSDEAEPVARRHAAYFCGLLERANSSSSGRNDGAGAVPLEHLGNARAALEWSLSDRGDAELGTALAAAAARPLIEMSLLDECRRWTERALARLDDKARGTGREMELQGALGHSLMFTKGNSEQVHSALARGVEIAERLNDRFNQIRLLNRMHMYHRRTGNFGCLLPVAQRVEAVAAEIGDPVGVAAAHTLLGVSYHLVGSQAEALTHLDAVSRMPAASQGITTTHFAFHRNPSITLARVLWLQGYPDRAIKAARQAVQETAALSDHVTTCIALIWGVSVFQRVGDWAAAEGYTEHLIAHAGRHFLESYMPVGSALRGEGLIRRGEVDRGIDLLRSSLEVLHADRYELYTPEFKSTLAAGLAMAGHVDQALATIDGAIAAVGPDGNVSNMPEMMRIRGELLAQSGDQPGAEACFRQSIALADRQSALSWRLRAAISLTRLRLRQGRREEAGEPLAETYARFDEGFGTADLKAAKLLLDEIQHRRID
jgi:predicted ATPase/DNA-binding winged helix-turn-helix (wHTH) protein